MYYCANCGSEMDDKVPQCTNCETKNPNFIPVNPAGQNFDQGVPSDKTMDSGQPPVQNNPNLPIEFQIMAGRTDFKVEQKLLAFTGTYKVKDMHDNELMIARKSFSSIFRPYLDVKRLDGSLIGFIKANFWRTEWMLYDAQGNWQATVRYPFFMIFRKSFEIETPSGIYRSGDSWFAKKFDVYAPNGAVAFISDKQYLKIRDTMYVSSFGYLSPFVTCMCAVLLDRKFDSGRRGGSGGFTFS